MTTPVNKIKLIQTGDIVEYQTAEGGTARAVVNGWQINLRMREREHVVLVGGHRDIHVPLARILSRERPAGCDRGVLLFDEAPTK